MRYNLNTCDKCKCKEVTTDLIWITSEDFEPFEGENLNDETYTKFDALCESCYESELI